MAVKSQIRSEIQRIMRRGLTKSALTASAPIIRFSSSSEDEEDDADVSPIARGISANIGSDSEDEVCDTSSTPISESLLSVGPAVSRRRIRGNREDVHSDSELHVIRNNRRVQRGSDASYGVQRVSTSDGTGTDNEKKDSSGSRQGEVSDFCIGDRDDEEPEPPVAASPTKLSRRNRGVRSSMGLLPPPPAQNAIVPTPIKMMKGKNSAYRNQVYRTPPPMVAHLQAFETFRVVWEKSKFRKARVTMTEGDALVCCARARGRGEYLLTTSYQECGPKDPSVIGDIVTVGSRRYSLYADRGGVRSQVFGMAFHHIKDVAGPGFEGFKGRVFTLVISKQQPYVPSCPERDLSTMAAARSCNPEQFLMLETKLPEKGPDGKVTLPFGNAVVLPSVKNFIVEHRGKTVFMVYKVSPGMVTVRAAPPVAPLIAFGITVLTVVASA